MARAPTTRRFGRRPRRSRAAALTLALLTVPSFAPGLLSGQETEEILEFDVAIEVRDGGVFDGDGRRGAKRDGDGALLVAARGARGRSRSRSRERVRSPARWVLSHSLDLTSLPFLSLAAWPAPPPPALLVGREDVGTEGQLYVVDDEGSPKERSA